MVSDSEKLNAATIMGWRVFVCTTSMLETNPADFFKPIIEFLKQPVLAPDYELSMWTARIRNLTQIGAEVNHNGIRVTRGKRNTFLLGLSGKEYQTAPKPKLIEGQREALGMILHGASAAATPTRIRSEQKKSAQMALF